METTKYKNYEILTPPINGSSDNVKVQEEKKTQFESKIMKCGFFYISPVRLNRIKRLPRLYSVLNLFYITAQIDPNKIMDYPGFTVELSEDLVDVSIVYSAICDCRVPRSFRLYCRGHISQSYIYILT